MSDRLFIDPATFAESFAGAATQADVETSQVTQAAKRYLLSYLTAYYLVNDFNQIEAQNFQSPAETVKFKDMSFEQLLDRVSKLNQY